jgi:hypothetical protein
MRTPTAGLLATACNDYTAPHPLTVFGCLLVRNRAVFKRNAEPESRSGPHLCEGPHHLLRTPTSGQLLALSEDEPGE